MASRDRMLAIELGPPRSKGKRPAPPADDSEEDPGMEYGADGDEPSGDPEEPESKSDDYSERCAQDAFDAIHSGDTRGFVEAIKAIASGR